MNKQIIDRAVKKLGFRGIDLHTCGFTRNKKIDPTSYPYSIKKEIAIKVKSEEISSIDEKNEELLILRIYVDFSLKGLSTAQPPEELFTIEAVYRVDYEILKKLTEEEIGEFSSYNAVHNVWPFWRQHVYYIAGNSGLPTMILPLFRDSGSNNPAKKKRRKVAQQKQIADTRPNK